MLPRYLFNLVRGDRLVMTRFSEMFLRYHRLNRVESFLHGAGRPVVRFLWRGLTWLLPRLLGMPSSLVPDSPLPIGFETAGVGGEFYDPMLRTTERQLGIRKRLGLARRAPSMKRSFNL